MIKLKRVYEKTEDSDGTRVLVERLWPRGVSKERARIDEWQKEIAPSAELRTWYAHDVSKWDEFRQRYRAELDAQPQAIAALRARARRGTLTLVFAARDTEHSSAQVLKEYLTRTRRP